MGGAGGDALLEHAPGCFGGIGKDHRQLNGGIAKVDKMERQAKALVGKQRQLGRKAVAVEFGWQIHALRTLDIKQPARAQAARRDFGVEQRHGAVGAKIDVVLEAFDHRRAGVTGEILGQAPRGAHVAVEIALELDDERRASGEPIGVVDNCSSTATLAHSASSVCGS